MPLEQLVNNDLLNLGVLVRLVDLEPRLGVDFWKVASLDGRSLDSFQLGVCPSFLRTCFRASFTLNKDDLVLASVEFVTDDEVVAVPRECSSGLGNK